MNKQCKLATVLVVAVVFCFASASMVEAKGPIWQIFKDGTNQSIKWKTHAANPRFAKWKAGTADTSDDMVLDRETGLVWERVPDSADRNWVTACNHCVNRRLGGRKGWRLPTIEELSSLVDLNNTDPALPHGAPFTIQNTRYWSISTTAFEHAEAFSVHFGTSDAWTESKTLVTDHRAWCVRGAIGHDAGW